MKLIIATKNQGKIEGARRAFSKYFDDITIEGIPASSDVSEQPVNEETLLGAKNRVKNLKSYCKENNIEGDLYLSIESGLVNIYGEWFIQNIAVIEDNKNFQSCGIGQSFPVPEHYAKKVIETDFARVMDEVFGQDKERHNNRGGLDLLTQGNVSRIDVTENAFHMAIVKYTNKEWN